MTNRTQCFFLSSEYWMSISCTMLCGFLLNEYIMYNAVWRNILKIIKRMSFCFFAEKCIFFFNRKVCFRRKRKVRFCGFCGKCFVTVLMKKWVFAFFTESAFSGYDSEYSLDKTEWVGVLIIMAIWTFYFYHLKFL